MMHWAKAGKVQRGVVRKGLHIASLPIYRKLLTEYMHWRFLKKEPSFIFFKKTLDR